MEKSIYRRILANIVDDALPRGFALEAEKSGSTGITFAPGAYDGICIYHMPPQSLDEEGTGRLARALKAASEGRLPEACEAFREWTKDYRPAAFAYDMQRYVIDHAGEMNPDSIFAAALSLARTSDEPECVKAGLVLLALFANPDEELKETVRTLGLCDEFTLFAVWNMLQWEGGNREIFELARKVHGWGRIHAVERLTPETEEIRRWLLLEGTVNDVMYAYSALTCWEKSRAEEVLFGDPTPEELEGIGNIIEGLKDEGPVPGISALPNAEEVLRRFEELVRMR